MILDKATNEHFLKDIQFSFIELPKFNLAITDLTTPIDKWTFFIKHAEELQFIPDYANDDDGLKEAFLEADKHSWSKDDLIAYNNVSIWEGDQKQELAAALEKGEERGMQIGMEKGKEESKIEMILEMHKEGFSIQQIAKISKKARKKLGKLLMVR